MAINKHAPSSYDMLLPTPTVGVGAVRVVGASNKKSGHASDSFLLRSTIRCPGSSHGQENFLLSPAYTNAALVQDIMIQISQLYVLYLKSSSELSKDAFCPFYFETSFFSLSNKTSKPRTDLFYYSTVILVNQTRSSRYIDRS